MAGMVIDLGKYFGAGDPGGYMGDPDRVPRRNDPAATVPGATPNFGQFALPHVLTFTGTATTLSRVYRDSDEALRHSRDNARFMRNDLVIMECIEARQRTSALLNCHVEADDEKNEQQKALAGILTKMLYAIPRFMQYRENLLHAVFFGRYACANRWRWKQIGGSRRITVDRWRPVHGDKLVWRFSPDDHRWDDDQVGVRVGYGWGSEGNTVAGRWPIEKSSQVAPTELGLAYFLRPWERPLLSIHKHYIEDGEFETPEHAGKIHGVGIRSRIYWTWYQKQETLAWLMDYLERSAGGFEIWFYPWGNEQARLAVENAARERMSLGRNQILVPKFLENDQMSQWYDRIEPGMAGAESLKAIIVEYFGHLLKRYILGQTLTTESSGTGLGSNLADVHLATFLQIVKYDATNLEETLTTELLEPMIRFNFPWAVGIPFRVRIDTESENAAEKLEAYKQAWEMGLKIRAQDLFDLIGAAKPQPGDEVLDKSTQQPQQPGMGGLSGLGSLLGGKPDTETNKPDGSFEMAGGTSKQDDLRQTGKLSSSSGDVPDKQAVDGRTQTAHYSAEFERNHPREGDGKFADKGGSTSLSGAAATMPNREPRKLPGLPNSGPERKVDWNFGRRDDAAKPASAVATDSQFRSLKGQKGLFDDDSEESDREHLAPIHAAAESGKLTADQAEIASDWVAQHNHHPQWFMFESRQIFDRGWVLVGRVDRGSDAYAVQIDQFGELSIYDWPGYGKNKKKRFSREHDLIPLRGKADVAEGKKVERWQPHRGLFDIDEPAELGSGQRAMFARALAGLEVLKL